MVFNEIISGEIQWKSNTRAFFPWKKERKFTVKFVLPYLFNELYYMTLFFVEVKLQSQFSQTELYRLHHSFHEFPFPRSLS